MYHFNKHNLNIQMKCSYDNYWSCWIAFSLRINENYSSPNAKKPQQITVEAF